MMGSPYGCGQSVATMGSLPMQPRPQGMPGQPHGSLQLAPHRPGMPGTPMSMTLPVTPKVGNAADGMMAAGPGMPMSPGNGMYGATRPGSREQALEQRVAELEALLTKKDQDIKDLQNALSKAGIKLPAADSTKARLREVASSGGFRKVTESQPRIPYEAVDQDDPIDMRLEEFYNGTGSAIQFRRINRGFYRFGETILELNIINHKLMAKTEDGWNRSKFGPIEKFLMYYENIEREKACIPSEP